MRACCAMWWRYKSKIHVLVAILWCHHPPQACSPAFSGDFWTMKPDPCWLQLRLPGAPDGTLLLNAVEVQVL